ncbi:MAG: GntR family transcriptional regulator [Synechococcaceae cyanobacterium RL_1_2]|nr:GntR family transcriptional regulator [Synechococcaceae cyanobacterium RL_1_2]
MVQFNIQQDSDIPASKQLYNQMLFAIASGQYNPSDRLPSTRQLAMITGLHRNTISKVYRQLEETGLVESQAGSGIYVKAKGHEGGNDITSSPILQQFPEANTLIQRSLDDLLSQGFSLGQARELFLSEIDWRLRCSARVLVTVPGQDLGAGKLMEVELEQALGIPVQLVPLEDLPQILDQTHSGTIVTSRYFIGQAELIAAPKSVRVIPIDIYGFDKELEIVGTLPMDSRLGIVSLSEGILNIAEILVHSLRGEEVLVMVAQPHDTYRLKSLIRSSHLIITDPASHSQVEQEIAQMQEQLIRRPKLIKSDNYIGVNSISLLKRELGLN